MGDGLHGERNENKTKVRRRGEQSRFKCDMCVYETNRRVTLNKHMNTKHCNNADVKEKTENKTCGRNNEKEEKDLGYNSCNNCKSYERWKHFDNSDNCKMCSVISYISYHD